MSNALATHFRTMMAYETWANERSLASLETVPPEMRSRPPFLRATQAPQE